MLLLDAVAMLVPQGLPYFDSHQIYWCSRMQLKVQAGAALHTTLHPYSSVLGSYLRSCHTRSLHHLQVAETVSVCAERDVTKPDCLSSCTRV